MIRRLNGASSCNLLGSRRYEPSRFADRKADVITNDIARRWINPAIAVPVFIDIEPNNSIIVHIRLLNLVTIFKAVWARQRAQRNKRTGTNILKGCTNERPCVARRLFSGYIAHNGSRAQKVCKCRRSLGRAVPRKCRKRQGRKLTIRDSRPFIYLTIRDSGLSAYLTIRDGVW